MQEDEEIVREFLVESYENLSRLDQDMVKLEARPGDAALLASVFRTMHTMKGTCGFLGFSGLEKIAHRAESLLAMLRDCRLQLNAPLVSLILETVDATRRVLATIESTGQEDANHFDDLIARLEAAAGNPAPPAAAALDPLGSSAFSHPAPAPASPDRDSPAAAPEPLPVAAAPDQQSSAAIPAAREIEEDGARASSVAGANVRVAVSVLDKLMDLAGELVLARNEILQRTAGRADAALDSTWQRLNLITTELQEGVMKTRMQPIGTVWSKLPRVVRDLAVSLGKQIRLEMEGEDTELDRTIVEAIADPLVHLIRNACDHGIELPEVRERAGKPAQGTLRMRAYHEGGQVNIEIGDDGAGIDVERVKQKAVEKGMLAAGMAGKISAREALHFIFSPGFSTAGAVTNLSGRGVGMDVVKSNIERIGGAVDLVSRPGEGTIVKLRIPLTLAIIPGLLVSSGEERFVIPQVNLLELVSIDSGSGKRIEHVRGASVYRRRGVLLPIADLNEVLGLESAGRGEAVTFVVVQAEGRQFGLIVDGIGDTQEIVVKPLGKHLKGLGVYAGATILGDGCVALILDVLGIGQHAAVLGDLREQAREQARETEAAATQVEEGSQRLLAFAAGRFERIAVPLRLVARIEEFPASSIERANGAQVVQYRGGILPLARLADLLEGAESNQPGPDPAQAIVFREGERSLGLIVDRILDIHEDSGALRQRAARRGFLGSGIVAGRVTDFLDLDYAFEAVGGARAVSTTEPRAQSDGVAATSARAAELAASRKTVAAESVVSVAV